MDAGAFLKQSGARFTCVMAKLTPLFARISPALLFAAAVISSGGAIGAPGIPVAVLGEEIVKQVLVDFPVSRLFDKLIGTGSSTLSSEEARQVKADIESLTEKISRASRQNLDVDDRIARFAAALIDSDELRQARQCIEGLDSKLGAVSTELATRLDQIHEELAVMNKAALPTIEAVLGKGILTCPEFFRPSGPAWVDFQEGYMYERPEVADIVNRLKQEEVVAVKGAPASGKSSVLRNVGYRLASEGADVRFLGLRTLPVNQVSEISKIRHGYIFVDDAHLNLGFVENLLLNRLNAKIIVACRDVNLRKSSGPTTEYKLAEYLDKATTIKAADAAEQILERFEDKRGATPPELRSALTRNDLWMMAWQLKSVESHGSINEESVLRTVKEYVESIQACARPENVLLPASAFFEHEIPVRRPFLDSFSEEGAIKALETQGEVVVVVSGARDYVALHHSEVAAVYQKAFRYFDDFGAGAKKAIVKRFEGAFGKQDSLASTLPAKLLNIYLRDYPVEITNLVTLLVEDKALAAEIIRNNMDDISDGLEQGEVASRIGVCINAIAFTNKLAAKTIAQRLNVNNLLEKIEKEQSVYATATCVIMLVFLNKPSASTIVKRLNLDDLVEEIDKEEDVESMYYCIAAITEAHRDVAKRIVERLDIRSLIRKFDAEANVVLLGGFASAIAKAHQGTAAKVLEGLDVKKLVEKIGKAEDVEAISSGIHILAAVGKRATRTILDELGFDRLAEKIGKEQDVEKIGRCIATVAEVDVNMSSRILEELDRDSLVQKLEREEDAYKVARCLSGTNRANGSVAVEIAEGLDSRRLVQKTENDVDVERIRGTLNNIAEADACVAKKIVEGLDIEKLVQKLEKEEDTGKLGHLIYAIAMLNRDVATKVVERLDIERLMEKIGQEEDVDCIGVCFFAVALVNPDAAQRIFGALGVGRLVQRIDKAESVRAIAVCLSAVTTDPPTARDVIERLDTKKLAEKVQKENDAKAIGALLMGLGKGTVVSALLDAMDVKKRQGVLESLGATGVKYLGVTGVTLGGRVHYKGRNRTKAD